MANDLLTQRLDQLHRELFAMKEVDPQTIESLKLVAIDIRNLLEKRDVPIAKRESDVSSIRGQIERLESEHPIVTRFLSQVTDVFAQLGI